MYQIRIPNEAALYNPLDPLQTTLSSQVYNYIQILNSETPEEERNGATLQIICDESVDKDRIEAAIAKAVATDLNKIDDELHSKNRLMIWMYIIGILLSLLGIVLSIIADELLLSIISFFGSLAVREAVSITIHDRPRIKKHRKLLEPLGGLKVEITK